MPKRSKRSTRSSLSSRPDQKQAGQERPQDDTYPPLQAADSPFSEEFLLKYLDQLLNDDDRAEIQRLPPIYYRVTEHMRTRKDEFKTADLAERDHFEATVKQQGLQCFFDLLRKAVNTGKKDDLMAVFTYSTRFYYYVVNLVTNTLQVDFGPLHPYLLVRLINQSRWIPQDRIRRGVVSQNYSGVVMFLKFALILSY